MLNQNEIEHEYCTQVPDKFNLFAPPIELDKVQFVNSKIIDFSLLANPDKLKSIEDKPIIPPETECISSANFSQGSVVQNYCVETTTQTLVTPPDSEFEDAPKIQQEAQEHANSWLSDLNSKVIGVNTKLKQYCNLIITYEKDMDKLVDDVVENRSGAKDNFITQIGLLKDQAQKYNTNFDQVSTGLTDFRTLISQDGSNFKTLKGKADTKYNADSGEMKTLKSEIAQLEAQIKQYNAFIVGGGVVTGIGILTIIVGAVASFVTGGAATPILAAGIAVLTGGLTILGEVVSRRNEAKTNLSTSLTRYHTLQKTCSLLEAINGQLTSLITSNQESVIAVQAIALALKVIATNLTGIMDNVDSIVDNVEVGALLTRMLNVFVSNGKSLKEIYTKYETAGILPVQVEKEAWSTLFPYRSQPYAYSEKPMPMEEYAFLIDKKLAWQRRHSGLYVPKAA